MHAMTRPSVKRRSPKIALSHRPGRDRHEQRATEIEAHAIGAVDACAADAKARLHGSRSGASFVAGPNVDLQGDPGRAVQTALTLRRTDLGSIDTSSTRWSWSKGTAIAPKRPGHGVSFDWKALDQLSV
jgi:L-alanine-DL-glutamate epimerase-like enolase superfamily enzyme